MKTLIGGAVTAALGFIGLSVWFGYFLQLLTGAIPVMLLLGGGLAIYLGFDEMKDAWKKDDSSFGADSSTEDTENDNKEIEDLKKEPDSLKSKKSVTAADTVLAIVNKSKKGVNSATLVEKTGFNNKKITNIVFRLRKQGKIKSVSRGVYTKV